MEISGGVNQPIAAPVRCPAQRSAALTGEEECEQRMYVKVLKCSRNFKKSRERPKNKIAVLNKEEKKKTETSVMASNIVDREWGFTPSFFLSAKEKITTKTKRNERQKNKTSPLVNGHRDDIPSLLTEHLQQ